MATVLYIKANPKPNMSRTLMISDSFINSYKKTYPNDNIITLDLYKENINFLTAQDINVILVPRNSESKNHPILKYAYQFLEADKYVIAAPFWNLGIPAILKAYIDYICVTGITFKYTEDGSVGLCNGKKAIHIVSRGGEYSKGPFAAYEMGDRYLRAIFGFLGITDFTTIVAERLDMGEDVDVIVQRAINEARAKVDNFGARAREGSLV